MPGPRVRRRSNGFLDMLNDDDEITTSPSIRDVLETKGFWKFSLSLFHFDSALRKKSSKEDFKEAYTKDHEMWMMSAGLLATMGPAGIFTIKLQEEHNKIENFFSIENLFAQGFVICMTMSTILAFSSLNDFLSNASYFNMVPARFVPKARSHLFERVDRIRRSSIASSTMHWFGNYGHRSFYVALRWFMGGVVCGIYLAHGWERTIIPTILIIMSIYHIESYNELVHWGDDALPKLWKVVAEEQGFEDVIDTLEQENERNDRNTDGEDDFDRYTVRRSISNRSNNDTSPRRRSTRRRN